MKKSLTHKHSKRVVALAKKYAKARAKKRAPHARTPSSKHKSDHFLLLHDGKFVMAGSSFEIARYIHRNHSYSVDHALKYEGYKMVPSARKMVRDPGWHKHPRLHAKAAKLGARRAGKHVSRDPGHHDHYKGERVEISPHFDLWMRGDRYGTISRITKA